MSNLIELKQGVPQRTVAGPLLFNLNINDLPEQVIETVKLLKYANDFLLFCSHRVSDIVLKIGRKTLKFWLNFLTIGST